ncbi:methyltransferase domain-containing protein [Candidatus Bathyarchaeota archaeon]|nr:methyltransferase domain-containing protein [Candidatus Bathyarchaeota archaeon]
MDEGAAERVLKRIESSSGRGWLPIVGRRRGEILVEQIRLHRPMRVLEVGSYVGYSTILMARELPAGAEVIGIEVDGDEAEEARANIASAELEADVTVVTGDALEVIPGLEGEFDMVFLDADKWEYLSYLRLLEDKLHPSSVVIADNARSSSRAMADYLEHVRGSGLYASEFRRGGWDGVEISVRL